MPLSARETLASSAPLPSWRSLPAGSPTRGTGRIRRGTDRRSSWGWSRPYLRDSVGAVSGIPTTAGAFSLNFTIVAPGGTPPGGYLSVWPAGSPQPVVSTLNYTSGSILPTRRSSRPGTGGGINSSSTSQTDLIIDINGYYSGTGLVTSDTPGTGFSGRRHRDVVLRHRPERGHEHGAGGERAVTSSKIGRECRNRGAIPRTPPSRASMPATGDLTIVGSGSVTVGTAGSTLTIGAPTGRCLGARGTRR